MSALLWRELDPEPAGGESARVARFGKWWLRLALVPAGWCPLTRSRVCENRFSAHEADRDTPANAVCAGNENSPLGNQLRTDGCW